jgi:hypothetical protein
VRVFEKPALAYLIGRFYSQAINWYSSQQPPNRAGASFKRISPPRCFGDPCMSSKPDRPHARRCLTPPALSGVLTGVVPAELTSDWSPTPVASSESRDAVSMAIRAFGVKSLVDVLTAVEAANSPEVDQSGPPDSIMAVPGRDASTLSPRLTHEARLLADEA